MSPFQSITRFSRPVIVFVSALQYCFVLKNRKLACILYKMLSYRRDRGAGCVIVFAKSRRLELGDNILRTL